MRNPLVIAGAGIGGLSTALALANRGIHSRLVERASEIREVGAGLQLGPNGFRAFARLGIADAMDAISFKPDAIRLIDSVTGSELSRQTLGRPFEARFRYPYRVAYRADVQQVLLRAVKAKPEFVEIILGDGVAAVSQDKEAVTATLDSGRVCNGAALVGADGLWSQVRAQILSPAVPRAGGHIAYRAVVPVEEVPENLATDDVQVWVGPGHHLVCYKLRAGRLFNIVAIFQSQRVVNGWDTVGDRNELKTGFSEACGTVQNLIGQIQESRMWALCDRDPSPGWSNGLITLLGDAAHPMLPYLAQGACMAIEDAVSLADTVSERPSDIPAAFQAYEEARFARTASVQMAARETGVINHARGPARDARNAFLATRRPDDYDAIAWLFEGKTARPTRAAGSEIGIFGSHIEPNA